jgi:hypothetical protein
MARRRAPIVIIVLWFGPYLFLGLVSPLAGLAFGPEAAREVNEYVYGLGLLWGALAVLAFLCVLFVCKVKETVSG